MAAGQAARAGGGPRLLLRGLTQYLSLWIAARGGVLDADAFAQRLLELEAGARASSAFGEVAFGDPDVAWRDGDGPLERLAYDGGALLAFHLDVALRARGTTLARLLGAWMGEERPGYSLERLRALCAAAGAEDAYERYVARPAVFPAAEAELAGLGFSGREGGASDPERTAAFFDRR
jgi:predicted metalloprotease with PDZ domain